MRGFYYDNDDEKEFDPIVVPNVNANLNDFEILEDVDEDDTQDVLQPNSAFGGNKTSSQYIIYNKKKYRVKMGSRGGKHIVVDGKNVYIK